MTYGFRKVLDGIAFTANKGELVSLLGSSGCGKTTLLRIVAGLNQPTSGFVEIDGIRVTKPSRQCGFMYQDGRIFPWFRAWRNVAFALAPDTAVKLRSAAESILQIVGLDARQSQLWPYQMSGGMLRRVALARALAGCPDVLLLDEPLSALDVSAKAQLIFLINQLRSGNHKLADLSSTIVLNVTHDILEAVELSDRVLTFKVGSNGAVIRESFEVPLPYPRDKASDQFGEICGKVLQSLLQPGVSQQPQGTSKNPDPPALGKITTF